MKILIQSLLFIIVVGIFAVTSDKLTKIEEKEFMNNPSSSESPLSDQEFLAQMIEHHEGAIAMAKEAQVKSKRPEIRTFASGIISAQTGEINQMYTWRTEWFKESEHIAMRMGADMPSMAIDLGSADDEFDLRFLNAMITHHEGAIKMAKQVLIPTARPEIHALAGNIISSQSQEISTMQKWLKEWYGK
jgi:uncharacterized protein (DUF305 family)